MCSRTRFFEVGQLFHLHFNSFLHVFLLFWLHLVLIKPMVSISPYKYSSKTHYFLTPYLLFSSSLFHLYSFCFFFYSFFGANLGVKRVKGGSKIDQSIWGTKRSTLGVKVNLLLFIPKTFYRGLKASFLGYKKTTFTFTPKRWCLFIPRWLISFTTNIDPLLPLSWSIFTSKKHIYFILIKHIKLCIM